MTVNAAALREVAEKVLSDCQCPWLECTAMPCELARACLALLDTLEQDHMVWAAGLHSAGVDIIAEDARQRERLCDLLRERDRMRPVLEAALAWREGRDRDVIGTGPSGQQTGVALIDAIDAYRAQVPR